MFFGSKQVVFFCDDTDDVVMTQFQGTLEDGTEFDSSIPRGDPLEFTLGMGQVIKGWDQGLLGMCKGEKRKLSIPPHLVRSRSVGLIEDTRLITLISFFQGYGESGAPPKIPGKFSSEKIIKVPTFAVIE